MINTELLETCNTLARMVETLTHATGANLENCRGATKMPQEAYLPMAYERTRVNIGTDANGNTVYTTIGGNTQDERNDNIVRMYIQSGRIFEFLPSSFMPNQTTGTFASVQTLNSLGSPQSQTTFKTEGHPFKDYANHWYTVFSLPTIETSTARELSSAIGLPLDSRLRRQAH